jgi:hypothetical protein
VPTPTRKPTHRREQGTASVELIAAVPFLLLAVLVAAQLLIAGAVLWSAEVAARAGARAVLVGGDPERAALRALPTPLRAGARVDDADAVSVRVPVPRLLPGLPRLTLTARSNLGG